uniref:ZP domain-containing protein n=1 Tax=Biomphalaria glabrata TaxID=6526 RepID=A0A2C9KI03_BIOGL
MLKQVVNISVIFLSLVQDAYGQQIYLFPYNETKNCNISLVEEMDTIVMYGKVDFNGNIPESLVVNFDIKRETNSSFQSFCFVKVPEDCAKHFDKCNCYKTDEPKVFKLSIHITALKTNDEAEIRAELVYRETSFYSEIRKLPIVYGFQTDAVLVYANDQCINFKQTDVAVNDKNVIILSVCREKFASHCELQLTNLETGTLVQSGKDIVVYITHFEGRANFKLTYFVCTIERNISFSITTEFDV